MILNDDSRTRLIIPMTLSVDPTGSTISLKIDDTWHDCEWLSGASLTNGRDGAQWSQTARTVDYFAGPDAEAVGATVLALGPHATETRVAWTGGDTIVEASSTISVR